MKRLMTAAALLTALTAATASAQFSTVNTQRTIQSSRPVELGLTAGYASGLSGEVFVHAPNVAGPIGVKLSAAYTSPGDSIRDDVSINPTLGLGTFGSYKAQGLASEGGSHVVVGLDGTYSLGEVTPGISVLGYAGGRYGMFKATETYANDAALSNTYSTSAFGVGVGAQLSYALAGNMSLVGDLGVDHFFNSAINISGGANDTYNTGEAGYNDLRSRLAFPGTVFKAKLGLKLSNY